MVPNFSFDIAKQGLKLGFVLQILSTNTYQVNEKKPVNSLKTTMNKIMYLGMTLEDLITKVTTNPSKILFWG